MSDSPKTSDNSAVPTSDQLRHRIDSGETGEKVAFPDPSAAPLGTDAEAAGSPPPLEERRIEAKSQPRFRHPKAINGPLIYAAIFAVIVGAILVIMRYI